MPAVIPRHAGQDEENQSSEKEEKWPQNFRMRRQIPRFPAQGENEQNEDDTENYLRHDNFYLRKLLWIVKLLNC